MTPYYTDPDGITIYHGDCCEILPQLGPVDLVLTDPPYGVGLGSKPRSTSSHGTSGYTQFEDTEENVAAIIDAAILPLIRSGVRVVLTPGVRRMWRYPEPAHTMCFFYPAGSGVNPWGFTCWQPILCYGKRPNRPGSYPDAFSSAEAAVPNGHPCPKPIHQWTWLMGRVSTPEEIILDPFNGSGTTLVAAKRLGRKAIGIDIEEKYCEISANRLRAEHKPLFDAMPANEQLGLM